MRAFCAGSRSDGAEPWYATTPWTCACPVHTGHVYRAVALPLNFGVIGRRAPDGTTMKSGLAGARSPVQSGDGSTTRAALQMFPLVFAFVYAPVTVSDNPPLV